MSRVHNFKKSLEAGKVGEEMLLNMWHRPLKRLDGRRHDFQLLDLPQTLELKTDGYDWALTANFFIELWSDVDKKKPGGPWQAREHGSTYWVYLFKSHKYAYEFETAALAAWVDENWQNYQKISILNASWTTVGIKVPRVDLEHLWTHHELKEKPVVETKPVVLEQTSNEAYHANRTHLSSSMLKLLMKEPEEFDRQWNQNIYPEGRENTNFTEGSLVHSLCLEPDKVAQEYAFFEGLRKAGKAYQEFVAQNPGKKIISAVQKERCYKLFDAVNARVEAVRMLSGGHAEFTMTGEIMGVPVKARADYINPDKGYIVDLKTTSYPSGADVFRSTIEMYMYDLSAALYVEIAQQVFGKPFDFYFHVISKCDLVCDIYKASPATMAAGHALLLRSLKMFKDCKASGVWEHAGKQSYDSKHYEILEV